MATAIGLEPEGDFGAATQHVMKSFTIGSFSPFLQLSRVSDTCWRLCAA
jgi:hypothetical protein